MSKVKFINIAGKDQVKLGLRSMKFTIKERWYDLVNITLPVFIMTGLLVVCVKFWIWALGFVL